MAVLPDFASSLLLCISNSLYMNRILYCILMYKKTTIEHVGRALQLCFWVVVFWTNRFWQNLRYMSRVMRKPDF